MQLLSFREALRRGSLSPDNALLTTALEMLWRAYRYAVDAGVDAWNFAVEIEEFRRAQISNSELRWLLLRGYARHAAETPALDGRRQFRQVASLSQTSCFVIDEAGIALVESWNVTAAKFDSQQPSTLALSGLGELNISSSCLLTVEEKPAWDAQQRKLWVEGKAVKQFRRPAPNQQLILDAFQAAHWPRKIADPLPLVPAQCPKRRLHDAVKRLNRHHMRMAIRFSGDGSGRGVLWERFG